MKHLFPIFSTHPDLVFLDNANSTHKPASVIESHDIFLRSQYANIQRGLYDLSEHAEKLYIDAKKKVVSWIGAQSTSEIVATYSSTYAANLIAQTCAYNGLLKKGDTVLLSVSEHHANIVPWLMLRESLGINITYVQLDDEYRIDLDDLKNKLDDSVKVVALQHVSNVTGAIHPVEKVRGIIGNERLFVLDLAQGAPHVPVDVTRLDCDFAFFSGHKMLGTTGLGVLYAKKEHLKNNRCPVSGGGAINWVHEDGFEDAGLPYRWEPGTQNVGGMIALGEAIAFLQEHRDEYLSHESELIRYALDRFEGFEEKGLRLYGPKNPSLRTGIFSCDIPGVHINDVAEFMANHNVCVRSGHHCCQPLHESWSIPGTLRASLYIYNDKADIDVFFTLLEKSLYAA